VRNRWTDEMTASAALQPFPVQSWFMAKLRPACVAAGRTDLMSLWSGQVAPNLRHKTAAALMQALVADLSEVAPAA
jgi:nitronate monooxygenase